VQRVERTDNEESEGRNHRKIKTKKGEEEKRDSGEERANDGEQRVE